MKLAAKVLPAWVDIEHGGDTVGFELRPLTSAEMASVKFIAQQGGASLGEGFIRAAQYAVSDWRGVVDDAGVPVKYSDKGLEALFADATREPMLRQLTNIIYDRSTVSEEQAKKLSSP